MLLLQNLNGMCLLLLSGINFLAETHAYLPRLPVNYEGHQSHFSRNNLLDRVAKEDRIVSFKESRVGKNSFVTSAATTDDDGGKESGQATLLGTLVLLTVPLSWGTYVPVGESIYQHRCDFYKTKSSCFAYKQTKIL